MCSFKNNWYGKHYLVIKVCHTFFKEALMIKFHSHFALNFYPWHLYFTSNYLAKCWFSALEDIVKHYSFLIIINAIKHFRLVILYYTQLLELVCLFNIDLCIIQFIGLSMSPARELSIYFQNYCRLKILS